MDLEILEGLALSADRSGALAQLLPGSEEHDYFEALHAQHRGALDEVDTILEAWSGRHGPQGERYERLALRQLLYRLGTDPAAVADEVRDHFGVSHDHEAEVEDVDKARPTQLPPNAFDPGSLLATAIAQSADLSQVTDDGIEELLEGAVPSNLDLSRRRALLQRTGHSPRAALVEHVAKEIEAGGNFGSLRAHGELTRAQLDAVAARVEKLKNDVRWVDAVVRRMRPPASVDLENDRPAREAYLRELWQFVESLPTPPATLSAHVLWHLLDAHRRRDAMPSRDLVIAYLMLPRDGSYIARSLVEHVRPNELAVVNTDLRAMTGLPPAGSDEELVRFLVHRDPSEARRYAQWIETSWLDAEIATAKLLQGAGDAARATHVLGAARAAALRERIDLAWCAHNPTRFDATDLVVLDADVKHVPELVIKVFRIDPLAYFQHHRREVSSDIDLDGLAASHEQILSLPEPPIRCVRRRLELPTCERPGTYVIDLIGNGMSSRAVIQKGRLRHVARIGVAGHVVTILDEARQPRPDARAWIGEREYIPDANGAVVVPFSTSPKAQPMLLSCGDIATVRSIELVREAYVLDAEIHLDRQSLVEGGTARAIARVRLSVAGAPASLALLKQTTWDVTLTDRHGVSTTKQFPLALTDDAAAVLEFPLGEAPATVQFTLRGKVNVISEQREQELTTGTTVAVATMHGGTETEALYLARTTRGWVISALGKTGEPRVHRPISVALAHRWARTEVFAELATDARGRCELGELPGVSRIQATLGVTSQGWNLAGTDPVVVDLHVASGDDVVLPISPDREVADVARRTSIVELRGGVPTRHPPITIEPLVGGIVVKGLPPGDFLARTPGQPGIAIRVAEGLTIVANHVITATEVLELRRMQPVVATITVRDSLVVSIANPGARTRVHVLATRFIAAPIPASPWSVRAPTRRIDRARPVAYVSGRELGDEYRYVLDRRSAKRFPTLQLDKPSLLLNPWARRATTTEIATARPGGAFAPSRDARATSVYASAREAYGTAPSDADAYAGYDFLATAPTVLANLEPDEHGEIRVPATELAGATCVTVIVDDPIGTSVRRLILAEPALVAKDLRLRLALDPARHATQRKEVTPLRAGERLVVEDLATAKLHVIDSVERAHGYLLALRDDPMLRELGFLTRWHAIADAQRRELYSKYACHELHLFLYFRDSAFFDAVVRSYLAHKRTKTFVDHWLLDADLTPYLEPASLQRLNVIELALLARRMHSDPALVRILGDAVEILPPDPARDTHLIDVLLGASRLDADSAIDGFASDARAIALERQAMIGGGMARGATMAADEMADMPDAAGAAPASPPPPPQASRKRATPNMKKKAASFDEEEESLALESDVTQRRMEAPMFRPADRTQEWAENNWWHRTPAQNGQTGGPELVLPHRFWRDFAKHREGAFLSPWLGLASTSLTEAICALAVTDLPFVPGAHAITADGPRLSIVAGSHALVGTSQLVTDASLALSGAPLVVGQSYVPADDRHRYVDGEQVDNYIEGAFVAGIVYSCLVVLANPTSTRQRIAALVQIPRGSIPLAGARATHTIDVLLEPYGTHGHEYSFYFPSPGEYTHFPVHVSRAGAIVAAAPSRTLVVTLDRAITDPHSWPHVSQRGTLADIVAYLDTKNLAAIELDSVAWRMRDRDAYDAIIGALERRHVFAGTLWGYSLLHADLPRIRVWARALGEQLHAAGPVLDMPIIGLDGEALGSYEHLEYAPLTNARAHRLGPKYRILNEGLQAQYGRFLELVAHRRLPTDGDMLAAAAYLLSQDRYSEALASLGRVNPASIADRMQLDYLTAYAACLVGDVTRSREIATRWRQLPVDRWQRKFGALANMLAELDGAAPAIADVESREEQQAELAAKQPTFDLAVDRDGITVRQQHVASLELRFFEMDVELLFSRQPFVQSDVSRFSFIEPGHREIMANLPPERRLPWPPALRGKNVVVEAVGAGQRKAKIHYANDLATSLSHQYGQVRVQRATDGAALVATYVKVYARTRGGEVRFYKDGYTDLRGWFDYATLSTDELDHVDRFAILVCSDQSGAAILEASPPAR